MSSNCQPSYPSLSSLPQTSTSHFAFSVYWEIRDLDSPLIGKVIPIKVISLESFIALPLVPTDLCAVCCWIFLDIPSTGCSLLHSRTNREVQTSLYCLLPLFSPNTFNKLVHICQTSLKCLRVSGGMRRQILSDIASYDCLIDAKEYTFLMGCPESDLQVLSLLSRLQGILISVA